MLKSFRDSLLTTAMAMTPFLLTACGDDPNNKPIQKFEIVVLALLICTVSFAHNWFKARRTSNQPAF